ncbi:hypothetical protein OOZ15_18575 [Galbibacter sp. EGI 63066]|uniref:hypothetical protein n=1 Tax=Galbibacter sp. EGI 63066 TaxID=2993559 RepID=UPI0022496DE2|nr:hypothetical protein [Galbibacter sp. EGI 63066]MCX2681963.1 hypothetical protein [Galbibacter sp. EGI 63066]
MKIEIPTYEDIKELNFWDPPQPSSLVLILVNHQGEKIAIDFLPDTEDDNGYPTDLMRPKNILLNEQKVELRPEEKKKILDLLKRLIDEKRLGHPEGGAAKAAKEMMMYFSEIEVPAYKDLKEINYWVPPQPASLMLTLVNRQGEEIKIDFLPEMEDDLDYYSPRDIFFNGHKVAPKSEEGGKILDLLKHVIKKEGRFPGLIEVAKEMMMYFSEIEVPAYKDLKKINHWVPPHPSSLMLMLVNRQEEDINIDFVPDMDDDTDYSIDLMRPRDIFFNKHKVKLKSEEERKILNLLKHLIDKKRLGHPEGHSVKVAREMIAYFSEIEVPAFKDIKKFHYWVPPYPSSLVLTLVNHQGEEITVDFLPDMEDDNDYPTDLTRPRDIFFNGHKVASKSEEERKILDLLKHLIEENKLGHPRGFGVLLAMEMIDYFNS